MSSWIERVAKNILPKSENKSDINKAIKEWIYTGGSMYVDNDIKAVCQICDHTSIKWEFVIENMVNGNRLSVGSECILKFELNAIEKGKYFEGDEVKTLINRKKREILKEQRRNAAFNAILQVGLHDTDFNIDSFIEYYAENDGISPKQISTLVWKFKKNNINYELKNFTISLKRKKFREQIESMEIWKLKQIWDALSNEQQKKYIHLKKW